MKKTKFLDMTDDFGINLKDLSIYIEEVNMKPNSHGVYEADGKWNYYYVKPDGRFVQILMKSEDAAFDKLYGRMFKDLRDGGYINSAITEKVVTIKKNRICHFISKCCKITMKQAEDIWFFLRQNMRVLFEFKYCAGYGTFVPEEFSYKVQGYSVESIYNENKIEAMGAFNYMVYITQNLAEAEASLKAEKPRNEVA